MQEEYIDDNVDSPLSSISTADSQDDDEESSSPLAKIMLDKSKEISPRKKDIQERRDAHETSSIKARLG